MPRPTHFANYLNTPSGGTYQSVDRGDSDFDIRHAFTARVTYDLPTPGAHKALRTAFGGWEAFNNTIMREGGR